MNNMNGFNNNYPMPMNYPLVNTNTNDVIYNAFVIINKYILYIQNCLLETIKRNYQLSDFRYIIREIITHIKNNFCNDLKKSEQNLFFQTNNMNIFNDSKFGIVTLISNKIDIDITEFFYLLNDMPLYYESEFQKIKKYQNMLKNIFNNNKNKIDCSRKLEELNEYIYLLEDSLIKCFEKKKFGFDLRDLIKNVENNKENFRKLIEFYYNMKQGLGQMGYNMGMNQFNNLMFPQCLPFSYQNQIGMNLNQCSPQNLMNSNNNINDCNAIQKIIEIFKAIGYFSDKLDNSKSLYKSAYFEEGRYFEPDEVNHENNIIINIISSKVFKYIELDEKQNNSTLEREGKFLYKIGGIARKSLEITNKLYSELFEIYKIELKDLNKLNYNQIDEQNLSKWIKNRFDIKNFIENSAEKYKQNISKYLMYENDVDVEFLLKIFKYFLRLFLKCSLSIPLVEVEFLDDKNVIDKPINTDIMIDLIIKNKKYNVNFCFLPQLTSNGGLIPGAKFHVFTYNKNETYKQNLIDYEPVKQNTELKY